jgi:hypothetical protein
MLEQVGLTQVAGAQKNATGWVVLSYKFGEGTRAV